MFCKLPKRNRRQQVNKEGHTGSIPLGDQFSTNDFVMILIEIGSPEVEYDIKPEAKNGEVIKSIHITVIIVLIEEAHDDWKHHRVDNDQDHHKEIPRDFDPPTAAYD